MIEIHNKSKNPIKTITDMKRIIYARLSHFREKKFFDGETFSLLIREISTITTSIDGMTITMQVSYPYVFFMTNLSVMILYFLVLLPINAWNVSGLILGPFVYSVYTTFFLSSLIYKKWLKGPFDSDRAMRCFDHEKETYDTINSIIDRFK